MVQADLAEARRSFAVWAEFRRFARRPPTPLQPAERAELLASCAGWGSPVR